MFSINLFYNISSHKNKILIVIFILLLFVYKKIQISDMIIRLKKNFYPNFIYTIPLKIKTYTITET